MLAQHLSPCSPSTWLVWFPHCMAIINGKWLLPKAARLLIQPQVMQSLLRYLSKVNHRASPDSRGEDNTGHEYWKTWFIWGPSLQNGHHKLRYRQVQSAIGAQNLTLTDCLSQSLFQTGTLSCFGWEKSFWRVIQDFKLQAQKNEETNHTILKLISPLLY